MSGSITLAADVEASPAHIFEILSTTEGHRGFWTEDCEVSTDRARFGFSVDADRPRGGRDRGADQRRPHAGDLRLPVLGGIDVGMGAR